MSEPTPVADPTILTTKLLHHELKGIRRELVLREETREREHGAFQAIIEEKLVDLGALNEERFAAQGREDAIREAHRIELKADAETHRLELKSDGEKTLTTATIAAEKAVQAALAAAEKARDQQTIASQLATTKAEDASKERQDQQGEMFSTGIAGLSTGFNDVKLQLSELRAERRGGQEQVIEHRASTGQWIAVAAVGATLFGALVVALINMLLG